MLTIACCLAVGLGIGLGLELYFLPGSSGVVDH